MDKYESLRHSAWDCKCYIVFIRNVGARPSTGAPAKLVTVGKADAINPSLPSVPVLQGSSVMPQSSPYAPVVHSRRNRVGDLCPSEERRRLTL
jgi:hypothetical protein